MTIWRFTARVMSGVSDLVPMPTGAKILSVGRKPDQPRGEISIWALVDELAQAEQREIFVIGTGWSGDAAPFAIEYRDMRFVGTVVDGPYVWHVFERRRSGSSSNPMGRMSGTSFER